MEKQYVDFARSQHSNMPVGHATRAWGAGGGEWEMTAGALPPLSQESVWGRPPSGFIFMSPVVEGQEIWSTGWRDELGEKENILFVARDVFSSEG
jgi:hypothetical protein